MTPYELQATLKAFAALVEKVPTLLERELDETATSGIEGISSKISRAMEAVKQFEAVFSQKQDELCKQIDEAYDRVKAKREAMQKKLQELPKFELPFNSYDLDRIKQFCETADKLRGLDDISFLRFLRVAQAFAKE